MASLWAILDIEQNDFSNSESLSAPLPPIKFLLNLHYGLGGYVV